MGAVSMGTGVMIGAGVFALMGQVAGTAGAWFPLAFVAAAAVAGTTAYSYVKLSNTFPSAGGIGMFLNKAYGIGPIAATFTMAMWASMILNESLVARTFGTYVTRLFGTSTATIWVAGLGVALLVGSFAANAAGNRVVNTTESVMAVVKIGGLVVFAAACLWVADFPASEPGSVAPQTIDSFIAAVAIALLAYKGFTTITNTGDEIENPHTNVGRAIIISIAVVSLIYVAVALAVRGNLSLGSIVDARDYSLAQAAAPVFGSTGFKLVAALAVIATITSVMASMYSTSRMLGMMSDMGEVPEVTARQITALRTTITDRDNRCGDHTHRGVRPHSNRRSWRVRLPLPRHRHPLGSLALLARRHRGPLAPASGRGRARRGHPHRIPRVPDAHRLDRGRCFCRVCGDGGWRRIPLHDTIRRFER